MTETTGLFGAGNCATNALSTLKTVRSESKVNYVIQLNCEGVCTYASCETTSNIGELQSLTSIKNASLFRQTMARYI